MDDAVAQFMAITDQDATVAAGCLGMTDGDVMAAVNMFFENPDIASSFRQPPAAAAAGASSLSGQTGAVASSAQNQSSSRAFGREDSSGVIHIDSDDDDDFEIPVDDEDVDHHPANLQRIAQESDDAAMAQRLQEEMYGESAAAPDEVRAPIQRTTETLVAPSGYGGDQDEEFHAYEQMRRRIARPASKPSHNHMLACFL